MTSLSVETFATRLIKNLAAIKGHPAGFLMSENLANAIQMALVDPGAGGDEFPKMLYRGPWDAQETRIVGNWAEESMPWLQAGAAARH